MNQLIENETAATTPLPTLLPQVSVLIAGWERLGDNPFRRKIEGYGCSTIHMPEDANVVPKCDMAVLAIRSASHGFTERVRKAYAEWERPVVWCKAGFEPARQQFESYLTRIRDEKAKQRRIVVREPKEDENPVEKALAAEQRIQERAKEMSITIARPTSQPENPQTADDIIRNGYANKLAATEIADELNRRGFRTTHDKAWNNQKVSYYACSRGYSGDPNAGYRVSAARSVRPAVRTTAKRVNAQEIITAILETKLPAEQKLQLIERATRGELVSLIDTGSKTHGDKLRLWRTPIADPLHGVELNLSLAHACLIVDQFDAIRLFVDASNNGEEES